MAVNLERQARLKSKLEALQRLIDHVRMHAEPGPWDGSSDVSRASDVCKRDIVEAARAEVLFASGAAPKPAAGVLLALSHCIDSHLAGDIDFALFLGLLSAAIDVRAESEGTHPPSRPPH